MTIGFVAFHALRPEHFEEFADRTHQVRETLQARPGRRSTEAWAAPEANTFVTTARFGPDETLPSAPAAARDPNATVGLDEREREPRQVSPLLSQYGRRL